MLQTLKPEMLFQLKSGKKVERIDKCMCWHGGALKIDEYRQEVNDIYKLSLEMFEKYTDDEVYEVILEFRDDVDLVGWGIWNKVFKNFDSVKKYILKERELMDDDDEPMVNRAYWSVTKYKLYNGEFREEMKCCFSIDMELLSVYLGYLCSRDFSKSDKTYDEFSNHNYILMNPKNIELSYKTGDILKINAMPFGKNFYVVYGGEAEKGEHKKGLQEHYDSFYHWCIYESEDRQGLWIDDISNAYFTDYVHFENCPLINCEKVEKCPDEKIMSVGQMLKETPESWYTLVSIKDNVNDGNSNLEKYIFGGMK